MTVRTLVIALALGLGCSRGAPRVEPAPAATPATAAGATGAAAPDAQLTTTSGTKVALADVLHRHAQNVVVFYRGFW